MSSSFAVRVENLGKCYRIAHLRKQHDTLRDAIVAAVRHPWAQRGGGEEMFWALRDTSFEVRQGEVVGIIGRNGAGKSTLLKILSRITEPSEGVAEIHGRCSSLLEVGTGFHPELTGRENIQLNGSILGMKRAEIARKFDEIVAFAEIDRFLDTPVKFYSSGMYVRLAFAVAAHLDPEILLVDEVLAVGDIEFQRKCIGKMEEVAQAGRTVLVVSHSMSTVKALCSKAVLLELGHIKASGAVDVVVGEYLNANQIDSAEKQVSEKDHVGGVKQLRVHRIRLLNSAGSSFTVFWKQPIQFAIEFEVLGRLEQVAFGAGIRAVDGTHVFHVHHDDYRSQPLWDLEPGRYAVEVTLQNEMRPGFYKLHFGADIAHLMLKNVFSMDAVTLEVLDHSKDGLVPELSNTGLVNGSSVWKPPQRLTCL